MNWSQCPYCETLGKWVITDSLLWCVKCLWSWHPVTPQQLEFRFDEAGTITVP